MARLRKTSKSEKPERKEQKVVEMPPPDDTPTHTLRADRRFDLLAMVMIVSLAEAGNASSKVQAELKQDLREFELYEEKHPR